MTSSPNLELANIKVMFKKKKKKKICKDSEWHSEEEIP